MPGLISQDGKRHRLLGCGRNAEFVRRAQLELQVTKFVSEPSHQNRIAGPSARGDHVRVRAPWQDEAFDGGANRTRGESGRGCDNIGSHFRLYASRARTASTRELADELTAKFLPPRGLGRLLLKKIVLQKTGDDILVDSSPGAMRPSRSNCRFMSSAANASITMFPGPVSKAKTWPGEAPGGIAVKLAIPPIFRAILPTR